MDINSENSAQINKQILLDAHTGDIVREYPLKIPALSRDIFDSNNTTADPGTRTLSDVQNPPGPGVSGIVDVNNAYDFLGNAYNFYSANHGRDSIDGSGMTLSSTVRYCAPEPNTHCPEANAFWYRSNHRLYVGDGYAADDIIGHEYTHGVTQFESGLIYENQSGAINESFSDIWGEFIDLNNTAGIDTAAVRWDIGEDIPIGAIRNMKNPPSHNETYYSLQFIHPDRMTNLLTPDDLWVEANCPTCPGDRDGFCDSGENCYVLDNGGVDINSGIGNKLAYLLTDGETFNGQAVTGMGINRVAALFYEVNSNLLASGANYTDLYHALTQGAVNLGWISDEKNNLYRSCRAVEIADAGRDIYVDKSNWCLYPNGNMACFLGFGGPFTNVVDGVNAANPGDRVFIKVGSYNEQITIDKTMELHAWDGVVTIGQ